jgi:metallo-beta-lactamase family protein
MATAFMSSRRAHQINCSSSSKQHATEKRQIDHPGFSVAERRNFYLPSISLNGEQLPELNYFVDSPLSIKATEIVKHFPGYFKESVQKIMELDSDPFAFKGLKYVRVAEESKMLLDYEEPV